MTTLYLCGAGNVEGIRLALNINLAQSRWDRILLLDDDPSKRGQSILGVEIAGPFTLLEQANPASDEVANLVTRTTKRRQSALLKIQAYGLPFAPLIDPSADITWVNFGQDVIVHRNASLCANAKLGEGSVVIGGAMVGHGSSLGRCCVVAPGAVINARVDIGDGVYVGTNASILPDLKVGSWATIGANSAVVQDVPPGATVMGVPAQLLIPGTVDFSGQLSEGPSQEPMGQESCSSHTSRPNQKEIQSNALRRLRIAQEKYTSSYRSTKSPSGSPENNKRVKHDPLLKE